MNIQLKDTISGYVDEKSFVFYQFEVTEENVNVFIVLTATDSGDPDLFVNYGTSFPTQEAADWVSQSLKSEQLFISAGSSPVVKNSTKGVYTIGVDVLY